MWTSLETWRRALQWSKSLQATLVFWCDSRGDAVAASAFPAVILERICIRSSLCCRLLEDRPFDSPRQVYIWSEPSKSKSKSTPSFLSRSRLHDTVQRCETVACRTHPLQPVLIELLQSHAKLRVSDTPRNPGHRKVNR